MIIQHKYLKYLANSISISKMDPINNLIHILESDEDEKRVKDVLEKTDLVMDSFKLLAEDF